MNQLSDATGKRSRALWRLLQQTFTLIGVVASILGLWVGVPAAIDRYKTWSARGALSEPLVSSTHERSFVAGNRLEGIVVGKTIKIGAGKLEVAPGTILVANSLDMDLGATLLGSDLIVIAMDVRGGAFNFVGNTGSMPGAAGGQGGKLTIAGMQVRNTTVDVSGGVGSRGTPGRRGENGRDGNCDGFGRYRGADRGSNGENGGLGGTGGSGGTATYFLVTPAAISTSTNGGPPGAGGPGGDGGRGGRGCVGLGGSQPTQADGNNGRDGQMGSAGAAGTVSCSVLEVNGLRKLAVDVINPSGVVTADAVRTRLKELSQEIRGNCK